MKHQKYIHELSTKKGSKYLQIHIDYKENGVAKAFYQNVKIADYSTPSVAMQAAVTIRDEALRKIRAHKLLSNTALVKDLYEKKFELIKVSLKTKERHDSIYRNSIIKMADRDIKDISLAQLQKSVNEYAKDHSQGMVNRLISVWRQIYKCAQMMEIDIANKADLLIEPDVRKPTTKREVIISQDDFEQFMDSLWNYNGGSYNARRIWYMLRIMQYTGIRPAEALALRRDDIFPTYISINKAIGSSETEKRQVVSTKTQESVRKVPIHPALHQYLDDLPSEGNLLLDFNNEVFEIDYVANLIHLVSMKCGIKFNSYMLRHTFANNMIHGNIDARTAQDLMGHTTYGMTVSYARSSDEDREKAITEINKLS